MKSLGDLLFTTADQVASVSVPLRGRGNEIKLEREKFDRDLQRFPSPCGEEVMK